MNEKILTNICFIIILIGLILFVLFYQEDFPTRTVNEMLKEMDTKGKLFGRVEFVIQNEPNTIFIFSSDENVKVFHPKKTTIKKNDFVWIFATSNEYKSNKELFAHKVIVE